MLSDEKRTALIQMCHEAGVRVQLDSKFGRSEYTSVQSSWPALEKLSVAVAEAAVQDSAQAVYYRWSESNQRYDFTREDMSAEIAWFPLPGSLPAVKDVGSGEGKAIGKVDSSAPGGMYWFFGPQLADGTLLYPRPQASAAVPEGWREVMQGLVESARDELVRCEGMKCREPNCLSCNDELEATTSIERSREFVFRARALLAASQPESSQ